MAKKRYFEHELNADWREAREKAIALGRGRGHKGTSQGRDSSQGNDWKYTLYMACEFQDLGILRPSDVNQEAFNMWHSYLMSDENRHGVGISENYFKKRKEAYLLLMRANGLEEQVEIGERYKPQIKKSKFVFWVSKVLEAMTERGMEIFDTEEKKQAAAMAHFIHVVCPPRVSDTAQMRWSWIDLDKGQILFPADKNDDQPGNFIDPRLLPYFRRWKEITSQHQDGEEYLFPCSMAQRSGTKKSKKVHVTGATISRGLAYVRDTTILADGTRPEKLSSQKYRHSFNMRARDNGCNPDFVAKVLGDSVETVDWYYSRYYLNEAHRKENQKMLRNSTRISSEGTVQPPWLKRHNLPLPTARQLDIAEGFRLYEEGMSGTYDSGPAGDKGYGRWGI